MAGGAVYSRPQDMRNYGGVEDPPDGQVFYWDHASLTWKTKAIPAAPVSSVFGRVGAVTLLNTDILTALGYTPEDAASSHVNTFNTRSGAVTLSSADVTTALGFTPENGATSHVNSFNTRTGAVVLAAGDVTAALTFIPQNSIVSNLQDVSLAPGSSARNVITPTDPTADLLTLQGATSQSGSWLKGKNSSGTKLFDLTSNGRLYVASQGSIGSTDGTTNYSHFQFIDGSYTKSLFALHITTGNPLRLWNAANDVSTDLAANAAGTVMVSNGSAAALGVNSTVWNVNTDAFVVATPGLTVGSKFGSYGNLDVQVQSGSNRDNTTTVAFNVNVVPWAAGAATYAANLAQFAISGVNKLAITKDGVIQLSSSSYILANTSNGFVVNNAASTLNILQGYPSTGVATGSYANNGFDPGAGNFIVPGKIGIGSAGAPGATLHVVQAVSTSGSPSAIIVTTGAHTTLAASTEAISINLNASATVQFATGALATQRTMVLQAQTLSFVGASVVTNAATLEITGAPQMGTFATITNAYGLRIKTVVSTEIPLAVLNTAGAVAFKVAADGGITFAGGSANFAGVNAPNYNTAGGYLFGGGNVCTQAAFGGSYGTGLVFGGAAFHTALGFNIGGVGRVLLLATANQTALLTSALASIPVLVVQGASSQVGDILQAQTSVGGLLYKIDPSGYHIHTPVTTGADGDVLWSITGKYGRPISFNNTGQLILGTSAFISSPGASNQIGDWFWSTSNVVRTATTLNPLTMTTAVASVVVLIIKGATSQSADRMQWRDSSDNINHRINKNGYAITAKVAAPADAELGNSEMAYWLDDTIGATRAMFKAKDSGGTVRTGSVALA